MNNEIKWSKEMFLKRERREFQYDLLHNDESLRSFYEKTKNSLPNSYVVIHVHYKKRLTEHCKNSLESSFETQNTFLA